MFVKNAITIIQKIAMPCQTFSNKREADCIPNALKNIKFLEKFLKKFRKVEQKGNLKKIKGTYCSVPIEMANTYNVAKASRF